MANNRFEYPEILYNILSGEFSLPEVKNSIPDNERGFFNMLFLSCLRQFTFIEQEVLPQFVKKKIPQKNIILKFILALAITELLFLDTPDYAVVNSYTDIAKKKTDKFGGNFVNAILRNIVRNKENLLNNRKTKYFSKDFIKILKQDYTSKEIEQMENMVEVEPFLDITTKFDYDVKKLGGKILPNGTIRLDANTKVNSIDDYNEGNWWVQDFSSSLVVKCIKDLKGKKVLDLCAAPGGKTAQLLDAGAIVTAVDVSEKRINVLKDNMKRLNLEDNINVLCCDATTININDKFDIVLLDAPCSATGTYRRHPEIFNTKSIADVKKQAELQRQILEKAKNLVAIDGILAYSTCSLSKTEGEKQIKSFLERNKNFEIERISVKYLNNLVSKDGFVRILPSSFTEILGCDGFFIAILKRKI